MGSEMDPLHFLLSTLAFAKQHTRDFRVHFFGSPDLEKRFQKERKAFFHLLPEDLLPSYESCLSVITMNDAPAKAARSKQNSSLCRGIFALKTGTIDALISCANTGAILSCAKLFLPTIHQVLRPALCLLLPTKKRPTAMLDVGASASAREQHLLQFAIMGSAYQKALGVPHPKLALLNIGREESKGGTFLRNCYKLLQNHPKQFAFLGNIEPKAIFEGEADLVVTDGFSGNIFLKTAEALVDVLQEQGGTFCKEETSAHFPFVKSHPGALLLGTEGLILKCHGNTKIGEVFASIKNALRLIKSDLIRKITECF